jgi:hypothetical protein
MRKTWFGRGKNCGMTVEERFWEKVDKTNPDGCWIWVGARSGNRAGLFAITKYNRIIPYRFSYELKYGKIPEGLFACHKCDNGLCVNPDHIFIGSQTDNMRDMSEKDRSHHTHGADLHRGCLTDNDIREIRKFYHDQKLSTRKIAQMYGVGKTTIEQILNGITWAHVK